MTQYSLFVLNVPLNTNQPTISDICYDDKLGQTIPTILVRKRVQEYQGIQERKEKFISKFVCFTVCFGNSEL